MGCSALVQGLPFAGEVRHFILVPDKWAPRDQRNMRSARFLAVRSICSDRTWKALWADTPWGGLWVTALVVGGGPGGRSSRRMDGRSFDGRWDDRWPWLGCGMHVREFDSLGLWRPKRPPVLTSNIHAEEVRQIQLTQ